MVIYFSWSGNTKAYAEELAKKKGLAVFQLKEENQRKGKMSFIKGCLQGITKKQSKVVSLPDISKCEEVFVCTPIWASGPAPAIRYFLSNSNLRGKKVNFIFTYGGMTEPDVFKKNTEQLLTDKGCSIGAMYAFTAKFKQQPDLEIIKNNIDEAVK